MEKVFFSFYSYSPRMRVEFSMNLHTVPVVGDFIRVRPELITEISKKLIDREQIKEFGKTFVVTSRIKYMTSHYKEDWRIRLSPVEPLKDKKQ